MSVYFLAEIEKINDDKMYREYIKKAKPIIDSFGGKYIFKSERLNPLAGNWNVMRIILIEFENINKLKDCFQSEEYQKVKHLRENSVLSKGIIIE